MLGLAEGDNTYAEPRLLRIEQPVQNLADDCRGLGPIGPALPLVVFTDNRTERDPEFLMGRGKGKQPVAVIMVITEGNKTFMAAAVVPVEMSFGKLGSDAVVKDAFHIFHEIVIRIGTITAIRSREEIGRRQLFRIANYDRLLTAGNGTNGIPDRNLRGLVEDNNIKD